MTNTQVDGSNLVVVDGSNIATEGRSIPSLAQLNEAVMSLVQEFPDITVTVVVDATFGHRIEKSEVAEFDEAVAHNELVSPPAGAIGRGDAFVLSIANKVGARIFSNDSFQEFHGVYPWLFDEGRLIGGKPVPHVGWVFVNRVPVKGPLSRKARGAGRDGGRDGGSRRTASPLASLPMPVPTSPPPRAANADAAASAPSGRGRGRKAAAAAATSAEAVPATGRDATATPTAPSAAPSGGPVNDLLPFLDFIQQHPVGSSVTGVVESYSSHGAYVTIGDLRGYVPLRLMGNPPPRSAREVMRSGERVTLVVTSIAPARRSVDLAVPGVGDIAVATLPDAEAAPKPARGRAAKKAAAQTAALESAVAEAAVREPPPGRRKKAAVTAAPDPAPTEQPVKKRAASKSAAKKLAAASVAPAAEPKQSAAPAKRTRAKASADVATKPAAVATTKSAPKRAAAKKVAAKKSTAATVEASSKDADAVSPQARRRRQAKPATD